MKLLNQAGCSSLLTKKLVGRIGKVGKTPKEQLIAHSFGRSIFPNMDAKWRASTSARRCPTRRKFRRYGLGVTNYKRVTGKFPVELDLHNQIRCLSDHTIPFLLNKQNPEHRLKSSLCFGFIGRRQAWRSVDFCCRKGKVLLKLEQGSVWFQHKQEH